MNIALFSFFFRVSSRKTSCNNFCSLSLNNLNSKEKVSSPSIYHWNRVSRASKFGFRLGCGLFIYREIGIFLWISSRQITRPWRDCGFFPRIRGLFMSEISRDRVEKFHSLFIGSSFESWMAQKEKKIVVHGCFMRIINWILDELLNDSSIMNIGNIFLIIREARNFPSFFFYAVFHWIRSFNFVYRETTWPINCVYITFPSKELALICFFISRKYFKLLSQWQNIVHL